MQLDNKGVIMSNMKQYISQNSVRKKQSHSLVDCFLEVSRYLFLPELSKLTKRSESPELLFTATSNYRVKVEILAAYQLFESLLGCI